MASMTTSDLKRGEGSFGLHALPSDRTVTAPRGESSRSHGRWRGSFAPGVQAKPPDSDSDLGLRRPTRTSDADFRLGPAKRILTSDFGLRHSVSVFGRQFERAHVPSK